MGSGAQLAHSPQYYALHGAHCTALMEVDADGRAVWRHWGARIDALPPAPVAALTPAASFALDARPTMPLFPTFGGGWFGAAAVMAHRAGRDFAPDLRVAAADWVVAESHLCLTLRCAATRMAVTLDLVMAHDVLALSAALTNAGDALLDVQTLMSGAVPLPADAARVRFFTGRHNGEFDAADEVLTRGIWRRENWRGLTSHDAFPGAMVVMPGANDQAGGVYGAQLAWSGNHAQQIAWSDEGHFVWSAGAALAPGEGRLEPGETLTAPQWLLTYSDAGVDGAAQNYHAWVRGAMAWPGGAMTPRKVHINSWEGFYFDHDETRLMALADRAAALGIERFVLDDGWFAGRHDDRAGLGDWRVDAGKYPAGLGPLAAHVQGLGMEFGLWVEPEMINPDSDLYRAHPDWALQVSGTPLMTARHQLVLDIARADVADYLFGVIDALLRAWPIAYLKWDHNRDLVYAGGADGRARYRAQVLAAYALFDRIRAAHPGVEIEACAGGGGRIDAGIIQHTHRFWTSDNIDATSRVAIQRGFLNYFPPEIMGAHVGASPAHATGRAQAMGWRCAVALPGHFGVELDPAILTDDERAELADWIDFYKAHRAQLHHGRVWRGDAGDGVLWQAHGGADETADDLLLILYRLTPSRQKGPVTVRLPMLRAGGAVGVEHLRQTHSGGHAPSDAPLFAAMRGAGGVVMAADWLRSAGLPVPMMGAESACVLRVRSLPD